MKFCNFCKNTSRNRRQSVFVPVLAVLAFVTACNAPDQPAAISDGPPPAFSATFAERPPEDDVVYFLITDRFENGDASNDRGNIAGDRLAHGFDPYDEKFYHGGDLRGVTQRLEYLAELGVTAIWITPIFGNIPVQQYGPWLTASYHGYWIADFLNVDPHLGSEDDLRELIASAHERGIKVILDIVINHTAHVIKYRECHDPDYDGPGKEGPANDCVYRSTDDYPDQAYTPYVDEKYLHAKNPAWLNDPVYYHNRGELIFDHSENSASRESFYWGDFSALDDVFTEHPRVVAGMIEIYQYWIREFGIDGFRIDTAGHVNTEFWSEFAPAMQQHAAEHGRPEFFMFGEVIDTAVRKRSYIAEGNLPAILNFDFQRAVVDYVADAGSALDLAMFFANGDYFTDYDSSPYQLPTFLGNHDLGRFGVNLKKANPDESDAINLRRSELAHAILFFTRGIPILYYGDEQGFIADPGFHESREDMFPSESAVYNKYDLIGTDRTTADSNFDRAHPLYQAIRKLAAIYREHPTLRRGDQITRYAEEGPGVFAFSRIDPDERLEFLVLVNNDIETANADFPLGSVNIEWDLIAGSDAGISQVHGNTAVTTKPLSFSIYRARQALPLRDTDTGISFVDFESGNVLACSGFVEVSPSENLTHIRFDVTDGNGSWQSLGIDRDPPFRAYVDLALHNPGSTLTLRARTLAYAAQSAEAAISLKIGSSQEHCE